MSSTTQTTWTCDRCGSTTNTRPDRFPSMWVTLERAWLHEPGRQLGSAELCNPCDALFSAFMRNVPVWSAFTLAAADYFAKPKGAAGNAALAEAARAAYIEWMVAEGEMERPEVMP